MCYVCADINECQNDVCDTNANCTDTDGGFECRCNPGYSGNGSVCRGMPVAHNLAVLQLY